MRIINDSSGGLRIVIFYSVISFPSRLTKAKKGDKILKNLQNTGSMYVGSVSGVVLERMGGKSCD